MHTYISPKTLSNLHTYMYFSYDYETTYKRYQIVPDHELVLKWVESCDQDQTTVWRSTACSQSPLTLPASHRWCRWILRQGSFQHYFPLQQEILLGVYHSPKWPP